MLKIEPVHRLLLQIDCDKMKSEELLFVDYVDILAKDFSVYFDVERDVEFNGISLDLRASFQRINERYFLTKNTKMYRYDCYEYFYVKTLKSGDVSELNELLRNFEHSLITYQNSDENHMSSEHTLILLYAGTPSEDFKDVIRRYSFKKSFSMGLRGFLHFGVVLRDKDANMVYSKNRKQKKYRFLEKKGR